MAVYGITGDGDVPKKYLADTLTALSDKADMQGDEFWLILTYDPKGLPNGLADVYEWADTNEKYVRVYSAGDENEDEQPAVAEFIPVKRGTPEQRMIKDLVENGGEFLVLLHTMDPDSPDKRDDLINTAIVAANQNGVVVRQLNNGMMELDLTATDEAGDETDAPTEDEVRGMGEAADGGDDEAATKLQAIGEEYGLDVAEEPYASMSWTEYAEAVLTQDAEQANAEVDEPDPAVAPQKYSLEDLQAMHIRELRQLALAEGWGKTGQNFPAWFLIQHIHDGTQPTPEELEDPSSVPKDPSGVAPTSRGRGPKRTATAAAVEGNRDVERLVAAIFRRLADELDPQ